MLIPPKFPEVRRNIASIQQSRTRQIVVVDIGCQCPVNVHYFAHIWLTLWVQYNANAVRAADQEQNDQMTQHDDWRVSRLVDDIRPSCLVNCVSKNPNLFAFLTRMWMKICVRRERQLIRACSQGSLWRQNRACLVSCRVRASCMAAEAQRAPTKQVPTSNRLQAQWRFADFATDRSLTIGWRGHATRKCQWQQRRPVATERSAEAASYVEL